MDVCDKPGDCLDRSGLGANTSYNVQPAVLCMKGRLQV
jgi:hypothetical protein